MLSRTGCRPGSLAEEVLAAQFSGLRPQGGVQAAGAVGWGGQTPPPLPRGAHGRLHHPLRQQVSGSREKHFLILKNL